MNRDYGVQARWTINISTTLYPSLVNNLVVLWYIKFTGDGVITCSDFSPILVTSEDTFCDWDWQYWVTAAERVMKSKQRNGQRIRRAESGRTRARRGRGIHHRSRQIDSGAERQSGTTDSLARRESSGTSRYIQLLRLAHGLKCQLLKRLRCFFQGCNFKFICIYLCCPTAHYQSIITFTEFPAPMYKGTLSMWPWY